MRRICAWCGRDLGVKEPADDPGVTMTICNGCAPRLAGYRNPVLVVSRDWARLYEELLEVLRHRPDIQVVLDRRGPSGEEGEGTPWNGPERRGGKQPLDLK